jgi:hypothetical protein
VSEEPTSPPPEPRRPPAGSIPGPTIRASDEHRERLIAELNDHTVAGRLSTDDLEQRLQAAYTAQTTGELDALRHDLPVTARQAALDLAARRSHLTRRMLQESGGSFGLFALCTVIWLASGANGQFWPGWVAIVFALSVVRNGWALYGPDRIQTLPGARRQPSTLAYTSSSSPPGSASWKFSDR